jgi:hypothetical protein
MCWNTLSPIIFHIVAIGVTLGRLDEELIIIFLITDLYKVYSVDLFIPLISQFITNISKWSYRQFEHLFTLNNKIHINVFSYTGFHCKQKYVFTAQTAKKRMKKKEIVY